MQLQKTETGLPLNEIMTIGKAFAESGMFADTKSAAQAIVKVQAGQEMGISPFAAMSGIHIIQGKPTVGAGIIAACIKRSKKYNYKVKELTDKNCMLDFFEGSENIGTSSFNIEDAKKAGTKNMDKFPKNMLFARAISNGVKWFCPDIFSGPVYTPEELDVITEDVTHEESPPLNLSAEAIAEMYLANNIDEVKSTWSKYKSLQSNQAFIAAKDSQKEKLAPPTPGFYEDWQKNIDACATESDLNALWEGNKATCEADPKIKAMFTNKNLQLKSELPIG